MAATATLRGDADAVAAILRLTGGWGADFVVHAVGPAGTRRQGVALLRERASCFQQALDPAGSLTKVLLQPG